MSSKKTKLTALTALLGMSLGAGVFLLLRHAPEAPPREALRQDLVRRDSLLYLNDETNAYTGFMIERYPNGALLSRSAMQDGVLHGVSEGWFTNGVLQIREHFTNGVSHGLREKFYPDGAKLSEANIVAGQINGLFRRWHPNGVLSEEVPMHENQPHGESRSFHPDGSLKTRAVAEKGKVIEQQFFPAKMAATNALSHLQ